MGDKQNATRVAWATIKLSQVGQRPVILDQLATHVGLPAAETARLLRLTGQERIDADVCAQQPFFASAHAPSRWLTDCPRVGSLRCSPSTPKPAASSTGWRSQCQPPPCPERGRR